MRPLFNLFALLGAAALCWSLLFAIVNTASSIMAHEHARIAQAAP